MNYLRIFVFCSRLLFVLIVEAEDIWDTFWNMSHFQMNDDSYSYNTEDEAIQDYHLSLDETSVCLNNVLYPWEDLEDGKDYIDTLVHYHNQLAVCAGELGWVMAHTPISPIDILKEKSNYSTSAVTFSNMFPDMNCVLTEKSSHVSLSKYFMIESCPETFQNETIRKKCERVMSSKHVSPVTSLKSNITYVNYYCALCNADVDVMTWQVLFNCTGNATDLISQAKSLDLMVGAAIEKGCLVTAVPPKQVFVKGCILEQHNMVKKCNVTGDWEIYDSFLETGCASYQVPVTTMHGYFKNPLCLFCNLPQSEYRANAFTLHTDGKLFDMPHSVMPWHFVSKTLLVSPWNEEEQRPFISTRSSNSCEDNQFFDTSTVMCRNIRCAVRRRPVNLTCQPKYEEVTGLTYTVLLAAIPSRSMDMFLCDKHNYEAIWRGMQTMLLWNDTVFNTSVKVGIVHSSGNNEKMETCKIQNISRIYIEITYQIISLIKQAEAEEQLIDMYRNVLLESLELPIDNKLHHFILYPTVRADFLVDNIKDVRSEDTTVMISYSTRQHDSSKEITYWNTHGATYFRPNVKVSLLLKCPYVEVSQSMVSKFGFTNGLFDFSTVGCHMFKDNNESSPECLSVLCPSRGIEDLSTQAAKCQRLAASTECTQNVCKICLDVYEKELLKNMKSVEEPLILKAVGHLVFVCNCLSLLCLFLTFATYILFSTLRTLPGIINMILALTMLIAHLSFTIRIDASTAVVSCYASGIVIHYFWLSTFCWMNICTVHMFRVFRAVSQIKMSPFNKRKTLMVYSTYAFGLPLICVCSNIGVSYVLDGGNAYENKGSANCLVASRILQFLTFLGPIYIILLINLGYFTCSVLQLRHATHIRSSKRTIRKFSIYCKLFTITGLTWLVFIIDVYTSFPYLWMLVEVANDLQGLFIFFAFIFNRHVLSLYLGLFKWPVLSGARNDENMTKTVSTTKCSTI